MERKMEALDARGLIRESYRIDGIGAAECRSIFLDWALGLPDGADPEEARAGVLAHYEPEFPDHVERILFDPHGTHLDEHRFPRVGSWSEFTDLLFARNNP